VHADEGEVENFVQTPQRGMAAGPACVIDVSILVSRRNLAPLAVTVAAAACAGSAASGPASAARQAPSASRISNVCGLRLPPAVRGEIAFRIPAGGRAVRRALAGGFSLCTLRRRDGTRFAELDSDSRRRVLGLKFFRPSGVLLHSSDVSYAATAGGGGSDVKCDSSSQASIGKVYWRKTMKWWIGATAAGVDRDAVIKAVRNAVSEWNNNINWCGIKDEANVPAHYEGKTSSPVKYDGKNTVDWGSLKDDQDCNGALACAQSWYDEQGNPIESDIRFNTAFKWSAKGASGAYDIQTVAAHEFGHVFQFDHVTNDEKRDDTVLMWPYIDMADTTGHKLGRGDALEDNSHY
jgi:hypothetical protein